MSCSGGTYKALKSKGRNMCIAFPGKIISINDDNCATIDVGGTKLETRLDIVNEEVKTGDYVICHAGFALQKVDYDEAQERLKLLKEIIDGGVF
jgi:hydrogenase expression/formation protein HypC